MAVPVKIFPYQAQLADSVKAENPGKYFVDIPIEALRNMPAPVARKYLRWNSSATAIELVDGTGQAPNVPLSIGNVFPGAPTNNDVFILTARQGNNNPGVYRYNQSVWEAVVVRVAVPAFPSGNQLPIVIAGQFILSQAQGENTPGLYTARNGEWVKIASVYDDQSVRDMITALTGRVSALEGDNPVVSLQVAGNVLSFTQKDSTTTDLNLPAAGAGQQPAAPSAETINYGLTAGISALRGNNQSAINQAKTAAETAFSQNNSDSANAGVDGLRNSRTANPLASGSYVNFSAPAAPANQYYNPWVAVPEENISLIRVLVAGGSGRGEDDSSEWVETDNLVQIDGTNHKIFVRTTEIASGETLPFILQVLR